MSERQYLSLRRSNHAGQDSAPRAEGGPWRCRRSTDWVARTTDVRREDVLIELLDDAHTRIRELQAALERCMERTL